MSKNKNNIINLEFESKDIKWENADSALICIDSNNSFFISKKFVRKVEDKVLVGIIEHWKYNLVNNYFSMSKNDWVKEKSQKSGIFLINLFTTARVKEAENIEWEGGKLLGLECLNEPLIDEEYQKRK